MKSLVFIFAIVGTCFVASCTQRTCPTYTKGVHEAPQEQLIKAIEKEKV